MSAVLDHLVWATRSPVEDCDWFEQATGVRPVPGGAHPGFGTRNDLVGFRGQSQYLELLSSDPNQDIQGPMGERLQALEQGGLFHWAARHPDLDRVHQRALDQGMRSSGVMPLSRARPDGTLLEWKLVILGGHSHGGLMPFFIDWGDCPHPAAELPAAGELRRFELVTPEHRELRASLEAFDLEVTVNSGPQPNMRAELATARGDLLLTSSQPVLEGFVFA